MIQAAEFVNAAAGLGFTLWSGVPCSYLKPFINFVIDSPSVRYIGASNEGDAVAIASGAWFAGARGIAMFQNSGLGNAINPLTSLNAILKVPILVICTWRGEPGGAADEPQHGLMGPLTPRLFTEMGIPWELFPSQVEEVAAALGRAVTHMDGHRTPYALIMQQNTVMDHPLRSVPTRVTPAGSAPAPQWPDSRPSRMEVLRAIRASARPQDVIIATTGYTGRELYALGDLEDQVYLVGSMGCAASLGLGMAVARPEARVLVVDGDGALLMRLGVLATLGVERPDNLIHILLDNEVHDSTGGQATAAHSVDLGAVAAACGVPRIVRAGTTDEVAAAMESAQGLTFLHVKTRPGTLAKLPRPEVTPAAVAARLRCRMGIKPSRAAASG